MMRKQTEKVPILHDHNKDSDAQELDKSCWNEIKGGYT